MTERKKILFVVPYYEIGGTMTSLRNLLPLLDQKEYDVSVAALTDSGEGYRDLLPYARVIGHSNAGAATASGGGLKRRIFRALKQAVRALGKAGIDLTPLWFRKQGRALSAGHYDAVIAFQEGQATRMARYIEAPVRIAWVHSMYSRLLQMSNGRYDAAYSAYQRIVCVSETAAADMRQVHPEWNDRIRVVYNALDTERIARMAEEKAEMHEGMNLVSVGRVDPVKRFREIPRIAAELTDMGLKLHWTVIGGPADELEAERLTANIARYGMSECVSWIGAQSNPYPYIKQADALVCLSESETYNYTMAEAAALGTPVVTTDFASAMEFVSDGQTGLIRPLVNISQALFLLLTDLNLSNCIREALKQTDSLNERSKEHFDRLMKDR